MARMVQPRRFPQSSESDGPASPSSGRVTVPHITTDPVASLCPWPLTLEARGHEYSIPAWSAAEWLRLLMGGRELSVESLVLELVPEGVQLLMDESLSDEQVMELGLGILDLAGGRPWYITMRLVNVLVANWNVLGADMLRSGVDATAMSLSGFLDVVLLQALRNMEEGQVTMFLTQLELPPPGMDIPEEDMEMSREQFLSLAD